MSSPLSSSSSLSNLRSPGILKLAACLVYELLIIVALSLVFAAVFYALFGEATHGIKRGLQQVLLWLVLGGYYCWCWLKSGQTLAMQAWHLKVVNQYGAPLTIRMAMMRYILATISLTLLGLGFLWALVDKNRLFLHDRLLKFKIVLV